MLVDLKMLYYQQVWVDRFHLPLVLLTKFRPGHSLRQRARHKRSDPRSHQRIIWLEIHLSKRPRLRAHSLDGFLKYDRVHGVHASRT